VLTKVETCNDHPCPVDCVLGEWSPWSECGANCGGGVKERARNIEMQPAHGGAVCEATEDEVACHMEACNQDCKLSEWTEWSGCSKHCGGGTQKRIKTIDKPKVGTGECWDPEDEETRLQFKPCNERSCDAMLSSEGKTLWTCQSAVDVMVLMDSSGSLGYYGWYIEKQATGAFLKQLDGGMGNAMVGVEAFSGPSDWDTYSKCTGGAEEDFDMAVECKVKTLSHMTMDIGSVIPTALGEPQSGGSTLTSVALGVAEQELSYSRENATSVVVVLTDGKPISQDKTKEAAKRLQEHAKVFWVPIGIDAPLDLVEELASKPKKEHIIPVPDYWQLFFKEGFNKFVNDVILSVCPQVS